MGTSTTFKNTFSVVLYQTRPADLLAPRWPAQNQPVSLPLLSSYWPTASSRAEEESTGSL